MNKLSISLVLIVTALMAGSSVLRRDTSRPGVKAQVMTLKEKQKEHSKLYKEYRRDKKLTSLATTAAGDVGITVGTPQKTFQEAGPRFDFHAFFAALACEADAIIVGVIKNKDSQLTEDESFIFTDYEMSVEEVLKDNPAAPISSDEYLTITRPGGTVQIDGRNVSATDETFLPFHVNGRYLIFLRHIPATGAYKATASSGSFELKDNKTVKLTDEQLPPEMESGRDAKAFIAGIRQTITGSCNR